jgi:hypothetical protein
MVGLRVYVDDKKVGPLFERFNKKKTTLVRKAMVSAAQDMAEEIEFEGQEDISDAGNFGSRWTEGLHADVSEETGAVRIDVTHDVPYWRVFQYGAVIQGKPLLWIPLSFAEDAQGLWARAYPGALFRVDRIGKAPLLLTPGKPAQPAQPKYFGKSSVTIPKKFHLIEIARGVAKRARDFYTDRFKNG